VIKDFEGKFKLSDFKRIELFLRMIPNLKSIDIQNTFLSRQHMRILKNILWMKKETIEMLFLDNNSLDSKDIKSILMD